MIEDWSPEDLQKHLDNRDNVFLKLWKEGCGACKLSTPAIDRLSQSNPHGLKFGQISVTDHPEMLDIADSDMLPLFFVFKDQKMVGKNIGFKGIGKLEEMIKTAFGASRAD